MADQIHPLVRALKQYDVLSKEEIAALEALPMQTKQYERGEEIVREGDRPKQSCLLLKGLAVRVLYLEDGRRQIAALHIPGDFVDLHSLLLKRMDHGVMAFSSCRVAYVPHEALREVIDEFPHLSRLLWLSTLVDGAIQRAWITCMGRRSAPEHFAHLLCETFFRLRARDLVEGNSFAFPATQAEIGDMLGLSTVHVNRTLQDLRKLGLVTWEGDRVTVTNFEELAERAGFDPAYLNQWSEPR